MYTLVDFESRSRSPLKKVGGRNYWVDPSTEAICAVLYHVDPSDPTQGEIEVWTPGDPPPRLDVAVSHDPAAFDRFAADACGWTYAKWLRSSDMAQRAGLRGGLDGVAEAWLGGSAKDKAGNKLTLSLSRPSRAKKTLGQLPQITAEVRQRVIVYCAGDVEIMAHAWPRLSEWAEIDQDVADADRAVNDRGVCLDLDLVRALQQELARQQEVAVAKAAKALGWSVEDTRRGAQSPAQIVELAGLPNAQKETIAEAARAENPHPLVLARAALASVIPGKLVACLNRVSADGRVRDTHAYMGGHTGRWSSKGIQLHNLPRGSFEAEAEAAGVPVDDVINALAEHVVGGGHLTKRDVTRAMRSVLCAAPGHTLSVWDYSGIEARANAWAAGDTQALEVFTSGADPYARTASVIFGRPITKHDKDERQVGKQAELGCGYGMGPPKFDATCMKAGVSLAAVGVDPKQVVQAWRKLHAPIVQLWYACERAFAAACEGRTAEAGPFTYQPCDARDVVCVLPSGRPLVYREARATRGRRGWDMSYQGRKAWREHVYGGLLVENAIQATCRDLLADALVRCERAGLRPVLHVHDELVCELPDDCVKEGSEEQRRIMSDAPDWAAGLPIKFDGFTEKRYRK